jgi:hypothetical protein
LLLILPQVLREVKGRLGRVRPSSKAKDASRVSTVDDKAFQLVQVGLGHVRLDDPADAGLKAADAGKHAYALRSEVSGGARCED